MRSAVDRGRIAITGLAIVCFLVWTWTSYARWADFAYRTFDLAYYVQALWQLIHGRFQVSVENVPLLGNHVEPIVFLIAPIFALARHPMLFVILQNGALATMGPVAYRIGQRLGLKAPRALLLAAALLLAPATGYIALHEFHPEAFAAPFLLLMLHAWVSGARGKHWLWFVATLACKENMALLLMAYGALQCFWNRKQSFAERRGWFLWPMLLAAVWFLVCIKVITPVFNAGNISYGALYDHLGGSGAEIVANALTEPHLILQALRKSLQEGNLVWALLLPFLGLPLLRPRWLLISVPILLQHLLSWRSSEWNIYFHYAAPLLPFFWMAAAEALAPGEHWPRLPSALRRVVPGLVLVACVIGQGVFGPAREIRGSTADWFSGKGERARKNAFVAGVPSEASVVAPLPYLSHLALRDQLYSLHYILKGLKTLSRAPFVPPLPTDYVLIDYADGATFDAGAGYYHPTMRTVGGHVVPSSDQLLHEFLRKASWESRPVDELTFLRRKEAAPATFVDLGNSIFQIGGHTRLISIEKSTGQIAQGEPIEIVMRWVLQEPRESFPWLQLRFSRSGQAPLVMTRGLCVPQAVTGCVEERWQITATSDLPAGDYFLDAFFSNHPEIAWAMASGAPPAVASELAPPVSLGTLRVLSRNQRDESGR